MGIPPNHPVVDDHDLVLSPWWFGDPPLKSQALNPQFQSDENDHLVGGIPTHLKNMKVKWEYEIPNIWKVIKHGPNHQPVIIIFWRCWSILQFFGHPDDEIFPTQLGPESCGKRGWFPELKTIWFPGFGRTGFGRDQIYPYIYMITYVWYIL